MDMQYHATVSFGGQELESLFDTGSFDVMVLSTLCESCTGHLYNSSASRSYLPHLSVNNACNVANFTSNFNASSCNYTDVSMYNFVKNCSNRPKIYEFGSGPAMAVMGYEDMTLGDMVVKKQAFYEIMCHDIKPLEAASFDAIIGIGPERVANGADGASFLARLNVMDYSICLESGLTSPGWLTLGGELTEEQKEKDAIRLPVIGQRHWAVAMEDFLPNVVQMRNETYRNASKVLFCGNSCVAILDSGTSLILGPESSMYGLQLVLPTLNNCSEVFNLPNINFTLGGHTFQLPPEAYVVRFRGTVEEKVNFLDAHKLLHQPQPLEYEQCVYSFASFDASSQFGGRPIWVLGMPFFRQFHVTFGLASKVEDRNIWIMQAGENCTPTPLVSETRGIGSIGQQGAAIYSPMVVMQHAVREQRGLRVLQAHAMLPPKHEYRQL